MPLTLRQLWAQFGIPSDYSVTRDMPRQHEATRLVRIGRNSKGRIIRLTPRAASAWSRMQAAATDDDITLVPISGFRSVARQTKIVRQKLVAGISIGEILQSIAAPGCSEHHTGRALDIGSPDHLELTESFARTIEHRWLKKHAAKFGFHLSYPKKNRHGIGYEPWHWCWRR